MTNRNKQISWMSAVEIESQLVKADPEEAQALAEAITRVREGVADQIIQHRKEELADFAGAQHQIVRYEVH